MKAPSRDPWSAWTSCLRKLVGCHTAHHDSPEQQLPEFPDGLDRYVALGDHDLVVFGRDVLSRLVAGLGQAAQERRTERSWGPGVLGCAMWMDDPEMITVLHRMANACIVVTKQPSRKYTQAGVAALTELAAAKGLTQQAYPELGELAPQANGRPRVVGPFAPIFDHETGAVREVGFRKVGRRLVPLVHAKILLLGRML
jgi:hypothetical protein